MLAFDQPGLSYEYNTFVVFRTPLGDYYMARDSGCSCPTPFESYEAETMVECVQQMTQLANYEDAAAQLRDWGRDSSGSWVDERDYQNLQAFFNG